MNLIFLAPPLGPFGTGITGGVELTIQNFAKAMVLRGHQVVILAPAGSKGDNLDIREIEGVVSPSVLSFDANACSAALPDNSLIANMWAYVQQNLSAYDAVVNFAYDQFAFEITPAIKKPVLHVLTLSAFLPFMNEAIEKVLGQFPGTVSVFSDAQMKTYPFASKLRRLQSGIDISMYEFCEKPLPVISWLGRISPEKGLEDAFAVCQQTGLLLRICGLIQDEAYWRNTTSWYSKVKYEYLGFFPTQFMQMALRRSQVLLVTSKWVEPCANVVFEALACGVPVVGYDRGGHSEIIVNGVTGFLAPADNVNALCQSVRSIDHIDRTRCRRLVESNYSLDAMGESLENWINSIIHERHHSIAQQ